MMSAFFARAGGFSPRAVAMATRSARSLRSSSERSTSWSTLMRILFRNSDEEGWPGAGSTGRLS